MSDQPTSSGTHRLLRTEEIRWRLENFVERYENDQKRLDERLGEGASTMQTLFTKISDVDKDLQKLRLERQPNVWIERAKLLSIVALVGAVFFAAGKYPDREELNQRLGAQNGQIEKLKTSVDNLAQQTITLQGKIDSFANHAHPVPTPVPPDPPRRNRR